MKFVSITSLYYSISSFFVLFLVGLVPVVSAADEVVPATTSSVFGGSNKLAAAVGGIGQGAEAFAVLVNLATTIAVSLAFLYFFYNLFKYIRTGDAEGKEEAKGKMGWSLLAIIVITSLWGIIAFVRAVVGVDDGSTAKTNVFVPGIDIRKSKVLDEGEEAAAELPAGDDNSDE